MEIHGISQEEVHHQVIEVRKAYGTTLESFRNALSSQFWLEDEEFDAEGSFDHADLVEFFPVDSIDSTESSVELEDQSDDEISQSKDKIGSISDVKEIRKVEDAEPTMNVVVWKVDDCTEADRGLRSQRRLLMVKLLDILLRRLVLVSLKYLQSGLLVLSLGMLPKGL
ncbi:hypothetical protein R1flu_002214 [Riccia fluitans]|uniref:Uncharacterized protein n=1 Tax=Riccia fluitans TaxID=41844 RepID=A0ABD1Y9B7_9MARC